MGPPLGDSSVRDPLLVMPGRQLQWLQVLANHPGLVGVVHRAVAWVKGAWKEPTAALESALQQMG